MRTHPSERKRYGSEPVILADLSAAHDGVGVLPPPKPLYGPPQRVGAMAAIVAGLFGTATPQNQLSSQVKGDKGELGKWTQSLYHYHEGDLFTPGTQNYVFDYPFELPMMTIWGNAFLRQPNTFNPLQPPQMMSQPNVMLNGIGGLVAGQMAFQPLESTPDA